METFMAFVLSLIFSICVSLFVMIFATPSLGLFFSVVIICMIVIWGGFIIIDGDANFFD